MKRKGKRDGRVFSHRFFDRSSPLSSVESTCPREKLVGFDWKGEERMIKISMHPRQSFQRKPQSSIKVNPKRPRKQLFTVSSFTFVPNSAVFPSLDRHWKLRRESPEFLIERVEYLYCGLSTSRNFTSMHFYSWIMMFLLFILEEKYIIRGRWIFFFIVLRKSYIL